MKETTKNTKSQPKPKYKVVDLKRFATDYNDQFPKYAELCKGESVDLKLNDPDVINWLNNKVIIKV